MASAKSALGAHGLVLGLQPRDAPLLALHGALGQEKGARHGLLGRLVAGDHVAAVAPQGREHLVRDPALEDVSLGLSRPENQRVKASFRDNERLSTPGNPNTVGVRLPHLIGVKNCANGIGADSERVANVLGNKPRLAALAADGSNLAELVALEYLNAFVHLKHLLIGNELFERSQSEVIKRNVDCLGNGAGVLKIWHRSGLQVVVDHLPGDAGLTCELACFHPSVCQQDLQSMSECLRIHFHLLDLPLRQFQGL